MAVEEEMLETKIFYILSFVVIPIVIKLKSIFKVIQVIKGWPILVF